MHIGFLTSEYPHPRTGPAAGIGTSIKNMAEALEEKGIQISVFVYGQKENAIFTEGGIKFHLIQHQKFRFFGWYLHRKFLQNYLNKYIAVDGIDTIEAPDWTGITAFMSLRCPLVIRMNGSDTYFCHLEKRPQKKKNFWFEKMALQGAEHLLSVSHFTARESARLFNFKRKIRVIPNSIDTNSFQPLEGKTIPRSVLYFGSIIRKKGVLELSEIFNLVAARNPEAHLLLVGKDVVDRKTGRSTKELMQEKFSQEAAKRVLWIENLPYDQIQEEIAKAEVVVLPSFAEALPMIWIEAMAMEKALVTSDIGWAKEVMVDGKTGFTVYPKDHKAYSEKILLLLEDAELSEKMGKAARKRVLEKFSTDVVVEQNIKFYEGVVKSGKRTEKKN
ncbi:glycosyltransferase family 4 protein [Salinimicrobium sp. HB62]|uniref:glycosyltransferase family 4 protein n=1 Tax=Salinimicrobium sp. HB62 TaxID=3077781 RepID=UPI002D784891|nr:glycosyltransferase family 4 protein [Salinimicrobium sp. HB62]